MCHACYRDAGSPVAPTELTRILVNLVKQLYVVHPTGGPMHVAVDDWNLDDGSIAPYYEGWPAVELDTPEPEFNGLSTREICADISALLNRMTLAQRQYALAVAEGYTE